jgi:hypothetical protein
VFAHEKRLVDPPTGTVMRDPSVSIVYTSSPKVREPASTPVNRRLAQRADLERLRRRLTEPCELEQRDLLTLLSYAIGGDGDPIVGLLDDTRATVAMLGELPGGTEPNLLASLERRLAVALELYARATATDGG